MDFFGIGNALQGVFHVYLRMARQSGRTTALIRALKPGDRVVCLTDVHARNLERRAREFGVKDVQFVACEVRNSPTVFHRGTSQGLTYFDHPWVEAYYEQQIHQAVDSLRFMQDQLSGHSAAHIETKLAAQEINRWRF